jgi:hypothetical protein
MSSFSRGRGTYYTADLWIPVSLLSQYPVLFPVLAGGFTTTLSRHLLVHYIQYAARTHEGNLLEVDLGAGVKISPPTTPE